MKEEEEEEKEEEEEAAARWKMERGFSRMWTTVSPGPPAIYHRFNHYHFIAPAPTY